MVWPPIYSSPSTEQVLSTCAIHGTTEYSFSRQRVKVGEEKRYEHGYSQHR